MSASVRKRDRNLRGGCPSSDCEDKRVSKQQSPLGVMASEGVWCQGSLLGSWGDDRVRGLLWPFCSLCLQEEAKARRRVKSRGPTAPGVGASACVDERSSFPGYWETKANSARKGREGRRGERAGRHWASRAVFLLRTCYRLENQGECVDSPPHRARQTHVGD